MPFPAITASSSTGWTKSPSTPGYEPSSIDCHQRSNGTLITRAAEPGDRVELRLRRVVGGDDRRRHALLAGDPGDTLRHVAGARRPDAVARARLGGAERIALAAPRILNEPIGCRHSSLSQISAGDSGACSRISGVRIAASAIRSRAASISASGIRTRPRRRRRARGRARTQSCAAARSSTAIPIDLKTVSSSSSVRPSRMPASSSPSSPTMWSAAEPVLREREQHVTRLVQRRLAPVDVERARRRRCRAVELARLPVRERSRRR